MTEQDVYNLLIAEGYSDSTCNDAYAWWYTTRNTVIPPPISPKLNINTLAKVATYIHHQL